MAGNTTLTYLDPLNYGTSAETTSTLGQDPIDYRIPPDQFHGSALQIARLKNLAISTTQDSAGGTRLKLPLKTSNLFGAGESGIQMESSGAYVVINGGTPAQVITSSQLWLSLVDWSANQTMTTDGNFTGGAVYEFTKAATVTGIRFRIGSVGVTNPATVRCKLWDPSHAQLNTVDVVTAGAGVYTGTFSTPTSVALLYQSYYVSIYDVTDTKQIFISTAPPVACAAGTAVQAGPNILLVAGYTAGGAGDSWPGAATFAADCTPVEPIFTVP